MKKVLPFLILLLLPFLSKAHGIYVSPSGSDANDGTIDSPYLNIQTAVDVAVAGDTIYLRGGTYYLTKRVKIEKAGTADARICMFAYSDEEPVIDGSQITSTSVNEFKQSRCFYVNHFGDYWYFKNLEFCNANDNGMKLEGSYCIVENCKFHDNNDTGLQIGMYKDFSIEETQSFPISGDPEFNPGYTYCKYNVVINCDSYYNYDSKSFSGSDDGGDADGFACKLFPGPGTEFHGCRAWVNSDDNWDLYMVYHPLLIDNCWSWKAGYDKGGTERGNGNGFKLGGGGTAGGAAFSQSVGAHVVKNCVSFDCLKKGFDQNNAYEAMYLFNNVSFNNAYNYRFSTVFLYGTMYMRNNIGFNAVTSNHEFLSADKEGAQVPDTDYNSWTTFDGCDPYKDGNKVNGTKVYAQDHSAQFKSLSSTLFLADRQSDGSLPDNDFCRLVDGSKFIDSGENIENFTPTAHSPDGTSLDDITILYNDGQADMGAYETGDATMATLTLYSGTANQCVYIGTAISNTVYKWAGAATDVTVSDLPEGLTATKDSTAKTVIISGVPTSEGTYSIVNVGGENSITLTGTITISTVAPATLEVTLGEASQEVNYGEAMETIILTWGGGATDVEYTTLPDGISAVKDTTAKTLTISGTPTEDGTFIVSSVGGMDGSDVAINCSITQVYPTKVLTGDWYTILDAYENRPDDLQGDVITYANGDDSYPVVWDSAYVESSGSAPTSCTTGAINVERNGGSVTWTLSSLVEMKANIHFTGTRTLKLQWTTNGETKTWTSESLSKQTMLDWDMMDAMGIDETNDSIMITFINTATSGGIRIYDFYVKVNDASSSGIENKTSDNSILYPLCQTETALVVNGEIKSLAVYSTMGALVAYSVGSQVVEINHLKKGNVYIVLIKDKAGNALCRKFIKN